MAVKIGHSSIDENGRDSGGLAGDQTGKECCIREWYSKPWQYLLRCKDSNTANKIAKACEDGCNNDAIGYCKSHRNDLHTQAKAVGYDLSKIKTPCECDCSSFVTICSIAAGVTELEYTSNAPTTSTMVNVFRNTGKFDVFTDSKYLTSDAYLERGDILVKSGSHTIIVLENGSAAITTVQQNTVLSSLPYKCIDVSSYQGDIDWNKVKQSGISHSILKIIMKDLSLDTKFEKNWSGCQSAGVTVDGIYNYTYATTVDKAKTDAQRVLSVLNGRKCAVWMDLEDKTQTGFGSLLVDMINAYGDVITSAGYVFGLYTGMAFYNSYIKPHSSKLKYHNLWIARYYNGYNSMNISVNPNESYNPQKSIGTDICMWQYTSSGQVSGIKGNVDVNMVYCAAKVNTSSNNSSIPSTASGISPIMIGKVTTSSSNLNIRSAPNTTSPIVCQYKKNELVQVVSKEPNGWYKTDKGYVSSTYISQAVGKVYNCTALNMRNAPNTSGQIIKVLSANDEVYLLKEENGWYQINTKDNLVGYVSGKYIKIV